MVSASVKLTARQEETLVKMAFWSGPVVSWTIGHAMNRAGATAQAHMNVLAAHGLIEKAGRKDRYGAHYWRITPAGRAYLAALTPASEDRLHG